MIGPTEPASDLLSRRVETTPDRLALVDPDRETRLTYRELDRLVDPIAAGIDAVATDSLAVVLHPGESFVRVAVAAMRAGVTLVPLSPDESAAELEPAFDRVDPAAIVCEAATEATAAALADASDRLRPYRLGPSPSDSVPALPGIDADRSGTDSSRSERDGFTPATLDPDWVQLVTFTSGTSGRPKGVRLTRSNLESSAVASAFRLGIDRDDRWLVPLPMHHMGGYAPIVRCALYGSTLVTLDSSDPTRIARALAETDATGVSLVPTLLRRLLAIDWTPPDHLRFVLVGGASTPPSLVERALDAGVPVYPSYGATEASSQIATATPDQVEAQPDTVGQPLYDTRVRIVDDTGDPVATGETGEILVRGPTIAPGYLDQGHTDRAFADGWYRTGDLGRRDEDGYLRVTGRRSDRIVTGGETVDPAAIRRVLLDHPDVADAAVVGLPDEEWGEIVGAAVVPSDGDAREIELAVESHCRDRLASHRRPRRIAVVSDFPRTPSGTVDRDALRERFGADE
ncbi:class I adenylate-forming enzyme family protein [Halovivax limisalsi]|uniref:class I adenylate-forming enzyme family protein n=1 Tax=Halovivax limisalsi TaxID=1453760 RepID=UPI001FFCC3C0|nr:class I adenylate-forming enzyme family protein [Halovivax limisalsi]